MAKSRWYFVVQEGLKVRIVPVEQYTNGKLACVCNSLQSAMYHRQRVQTSILLDFVAGGIITLVLLTITVVLFRSR